MFPNLFSLLFRWCLDNNINNSGGFFVLRVEDKELITCHSYLSFLVRFCSLLQLWGGKLRRFIKLPDSGDIAINKLVVSAMLSDSLAKQTYGECSLIVCYSCGIKQQIVILPLFILKFSPRKQPIYEMLESGHDLEFFQPPGEIFITRFEDYGEIISEMINSL